MKILSQPKQVSGLFTVFSLALALLLSSCAPHSRTVQRETESFWTHLELGAGNYGEDGHTKVSQRKTVLSELDYVSSKKNYVDDLPEKDPLPYKPEEQYAVLFQTLDQLIVKYGPAGVFHVNDLFPEYAEYAVLQLKKYAHNRGYTAIKIEAVPGDYLKIIPGKTLSVYGRKLYDTAHLKNPEVSFYHYGMDGDRMLANQKSRLKARKKLQSLANLSKTGLYFFPIDVKNTFIPKAEEDEFMNKGIFYQSTNEWEAVPYYFPEGPRADSRYGRVFRIQPQKAKG